MTGGAEGYIDYPTAVEISLRIRGQSEAIHG
jgi:hypothetical protein